MHQTPASCVVNGHKIQASTTPRGYFSLGVNGMLIGNYQTVDSLIFSAREELRMRSLLDMQTQPELPREFMDAVAALAGGNQ